MAGPMQPNVSIAVVALHYRLNANMLRRRVAAQEERDAAEAARKSMSAPSAEFVPLQLEASGVPAGAGEIQIEVRRGAATVTVLACLRMLSLRNVADEGAVSGPRKATA